MQWISGIVRWFSGGEVQYHTLRMCMQGDTLWIGLTVFLDVAVAVGYLVIAWHWLRNERLLPPSPARKAMSAIRNVFIFCGICGYLFIPVKMWWPAWRLYDVFLAALVFYTWRYAFSAMDLRVVYNELGRTRHLAQQLEASQADVRRRSDFLNAISHDLRTPLNGLTLRTSLAELQLERRDIGALEASLADIRASAHNVAEMLDQLLDYARVERGDVPSQVGPFSLAELCREVVRDSSLTGEEKGLALECNVPPELTISTDKGKVRRVLSNLVGNAVKFTQRGSVRIEATPGGEGIEVHVIDTGLGIAPEQLDAIFGEFVQLGNDQRDKRYGFGLGLPIALRLARSLGGDVQVHSTLGAGSRFTLVLPNSVRVSGAQPATRWGSLSFNSAAKT
jgi:signal transduction histidine kinase